MSSVVIHEKETLRGILDAHLDVLGLWVCVCAIGRRKDLLESIDYGRLTRRKTCYVGEIHTAG